MAERAFRYRAIDPAGRPVRGALAATDEGLAFERLRAQGLTPVSLRQAGRAEPSERKARGPGDREAAEFLSSLGDLLRAGSDIRTALAILGERAERKPLKQLARTLVEDISGGEAIDSAFARGFGGRQAFVASMVSAGEASGDLPGGLQRSAEILNSRLKLREQLISVLAYPAFVLVSAIAAVFVILLFIVPSIAPLAEDAGAAPPLSLQILIACSDALRTNLAPLGAGVLGGALVTVATFKAGLARAPLEALILDGPARRVARAIVFGGFIVSLGTMLGAGAPVTDALRLASRGIMMRAAQQRLAPLVALVRQGHSLSGALETVRGMPPSIVRLASVGENTNALGPMLLRSGRLEEETALRRIESFGRVAGPALIVLLGLMLGVLMAGLLSGVSQMGEAALG